MTIMQLSEGPTRHTKMPVDNLGREAIPLSELIKQLQTILDQNGDLPVYAGIDYDWVTSAVASVPDGFLGDCVFLGGKAEG